MTETVHAGRPRAAVRALALAALVAAAMLAALALPRAASANRSQPMIFDAPRELRSDRPGTRQRALEEIQSLGADWVRVVLYWRDVAPAARSRRRPDFRERDPRAYDWHIYDRMIAEARERGLQVLLTPSGPVPRWATLGSASTTRFPSATRFGRFMRAVGTHYGPIVSTWSIWNEPNLAHFLGPQFRRGKPYSPRLYRRLFQAGASALAATGNGRDRLLIGETAPRARSGTSVAPLAFLRGVLCLDVRYRKRGSCRRLAADGWAHHPYTTGSGPYWVPPNRDDVSIGSLSRLTSALYRAGRAGAIRRGLGLWLTEFGVQSYPDPYVGVSQQRQAEWRSIGEWIAWRTPKVKAFSQYLLRDDLPRRGGRRARYSGFETGLRGSKGAPKVALKGFRLPLVADRASARRVRLWGLARPATGRTRVTIRYRDRGSSRLRTLKQVRTDRRGYFTTRTGYRAGRTYALAWRAPDGTRYMGATTRVTSR